MPERSSAAGGPGQETTVRSEADASAGACGPSADGQAADERLLMAYADPPYVGQSAKHYADHPDFDGEVQPAELIGRLVRNYPDGWALSLSTPSTWIYLDHCLDQGLSLMNGDIRLMAWIKPFAAFKRNVRVAYAWEPIIVKPARRLEGAEPTRDFIEQLEVVDLDLAVKEPITMRRGFVGAKPEKVCRWLFGAMGLRSCDELHDLYPGSGAVSAAWDAWRAQGRLAA